MDVSEDTGSPPSYPATVVVFPKVIKLNVGGHFFTISLSTLTDSQFPSEMLAGMFSGRYKVPKDEQGCYFIDRDGTNFHYILDYICGEQLDPSVALRVFEDAQYFNAPGLIEWCKSQPVYLAQELKCAVEQRCVKDGLEHTTFQMRILEQTMNECKGEGSYPSQWWNSTPSSGPGNPLTVKKGRIVIAQDYPRRLPGFYRECEAHQDVLDANGLPTEPVKPAHEIGEWHRAHRFSSLRTCDRKPLMFIAERGRFPESKTEMLPRPPSTLDLLVARFNDDLCDSGIALTENSRDSNRVRCSGCQLEIAFHSFVLQLTYFKRDIGTEDAYNSATT